MKLQFRHAILIGIMILGFALRLYQLDTVAFRGDEAFNVQRWVETPPTQSLIEIASIEPHPPLAYIVVYLWGILFDSTNEFALRMQPVLFNILGIPVIYALGKRLFRDNTIAVVGALIWAVHPFQVWHAQEFRTYGIWAGLSVVVVWLAVHIIQAKQASWRLWALYTVTALASCLIFYNELLTIGVLGLYVLIFEIRRPRFIVQWSLLNAAIILLTMGAFLIFQSDLISSGEYGGTTIPLEITQWWERFIPVLQFGDTLSLSLRQHIKPTTVWWVVIVPITVVTMVITLYHQRKQGVFLWMLALIPLLMLGVISTQLNIFRPRYVMPVVPAFIMMVSYSMVVLWRDRIGRVFSVGLITFWIVFSGISFNNYFHDDAYDKSPAWRDLITYLENHVEDDDIIIQTSVDPAFGLYYDHSAIAAGEFALPTNFDQPIDDIIDVMETTSEDFDTIWILGQTFPDWQNEGVVEDWAFDHLQLIRETNLAGLPVRQFMGWDVDNSKLEQDALVTFDDAISLRGLETQQSSITDTLTMIVYWEALVTTDVPLTVFAQLIGDVNPETGTPVWAQDDHPPQNGRISTDLWTVDEIYRDVYHLSLAEVPSGEYQIWLGFYDAITGERLLHEDDRDAYIIETIVIE